MPGVAHAQGADPCLSASGEATTQLVPAPAFGTTVVHASGHAGITLDVPQATDLPDEAFVVDLLEGASYAWVGLADPDPDSCGRDTDPFFGMCVTHKQYRLAVRDTPWVLSNDPTSVEQGRQELYVISGRFVSLDQRGAVLEFECGVVFDDANVLAVTITNCWAESSLGDRVDGLRNGTPTPTSATAGGSTALDDDGTWRICQQGEALYISGSQPFGPFCSFLHAGT